MLFKSYKSIFIIASALIFLLCFDLSSACTRILKVEKDNAVMVGRNMDWDTDTQTNLMVYPRNISRIGGMNNNQTKENWITWVSKYGSIVATAYEDLTTDGSNEAGLSAHILWLGKADYGARDLSKPGLSLTMWTQFYLDNFKSVDEAVRYTQTQPFQIVGFYHQPTQQWGKFHLVLDDASGDSALIEYFNGELHIYHHRDVITVTNGPIYDMQLLNLKKYKGFGGDKPLPGTSRSTGRFVRATYYARTMPQAKSTKEELANVLSILNNTAELKIAESKTLWHTVSDLTNKIYYFQSTENNNLISVRLDKFNLNQTSVMKLDLVNHPEYVGDMSDKFTLNN